MQFICLNQLIDVKELPFMKLVHSCEIFSYPYCKYKTIQHNPHFLFSYTITRKFSSIVVSVLTKSNTKQKTATRSQNNRLIHNRRLDVKLLREHVSADNSAFWLINREDPKSTNSLVNNKFDLFSK